MKKKIIIFLAIFLYIGIISGTSHGEKLNPMYKVIIKEETLKTYTLPEEPVEDLEMIGKIVADAFEKGERSIELFTKGIEWESLYYAIKSEMNKRMLGDLAFYSIEAKLTRYATGEILYNLQLQDRTTTLGHTTTEDFNNAKLWARGVIEKAKLNSPDLSDFEKIKRVHDIMVLSFKYDITEEAEKIVYFPYEMIETGEGVCQSYASLFKIFMDELQIQSGYITGEYLGGAHMWNAVKLAGIWYYIDITHDDPTYIDNIERPLNVVYDNFLVGELSTPYMKDRTYAEGSPKFGGEDYPTDRKEKIYTEEEKAALLNGTGLSDIPKISESQMKEIKSGVIVGGAEKTITNPLHEFKAILSDSIDNGEITPENAFIVSEEGIIFSSIPKLQDSKTIIFIHTEPFKATKYYVVIKNMKSIDGNKMEKIFILPFIYMP